MGEVHENRQKCSGRELALQNRSTVKTLNQVAGTLMLGVGIWLAVL